MTNRIAFEFVITLPNGALILTWLTVYVEPQLARSTQRGYKANFYNHVFPNMGHKLGAMAMYKLLLTATLITNRALDVFSQYKFINSKIFGSSFYSFRNHYFDMVGYGNHTPILRKRMEPEFTQKIHSVAFRVTKAECLDLPETTDIIQAVELEPTVIKAYKSLVKERYAELQYGVVTTTNVLTKLLHLSQLAGGYICNDENSKV